MKKITKKESASFHKNCEAMFKNDLGAVLSTISSRNYNLVFETKTGPLYLRVDGENEAELIEFIKNYYLNIKNS